MSRNLRLLATFSSYEGANDSESESITSFEFTLCGVVGLISENLSIKTYHKNCQKSIQILVKYHNTCLKKTNIQKIKLTHLNRVR